MVEIKENGVTEYRAKFSRNKVTLPGRKQIWRFFDSAGKMVHDRISLEGENFLTKAKPLIVQLIINGEIAEEKLPLKLIRQQVKNNLQTLPEKLFNLTEKKHYEIEYSEKLKKILQELREKVNNINGDH